jgi:hypothetical protein
VIEMSGTTMMLSSESACDAAFAGRFILLPLPRPAPAFDSPPALFALLALFELFALTPAPASSVLVIWMPLLPLLVETLTPSGSDADVTFTPPP